MSPERIDEAADGDAVDAVDDADAESQPDAESEASVDVDDEDEEPHGNLEDTTPPTHDEEVDEENGDETVPTVELDLYDLSVRVSGQSTDDLAAVEGSAKRLMDYLVDTAQTLEDSPDDRGLS